MVINRVKELPNKIHIIGSVGSGKTTLARTLSKKFDIPFYELDNVVWERHPSGDIRRPDEERDQYLDQIVRTKRWIIEGAHHHHWVGKSFDNADLIIFLDTSYWVRTYRINKRFVRQVLRIEAANYKPSFKIYKSMFRWNKGFEKESKPKIFKMLEQRKVKFMILKNNKEMDPLFDYWSVNRNRNSEV
ncbi:MAG: AAA family ATPase [Bacillaceae bacterium]|nr:AAA family ATPase [Bacillaceae bacterium]